MWSGENVDHDGHIYRVENARLFDVPAEPVPVVVSGFGTAAAEVAAKIGDGLFTHGSATDAIDAFHQGGGKGPVYAQLNVCLGDDEEACRRTVHEQWPNSAVPGQLSQDLPTVTHFEQAASLVREEDAVHGMPIGDDLDAVVEQVASYVDNGVDHIHLHQIGPDQQALFRRWSRGLADRLRAA
jgi:G6PDH family F420-dependent oxidoreductase